MNNAAIKSLVVMLERAFAESIYRDSAEFWHSTGEEIEVKGSDEWLSTVSGNSARRQFPGLIWRVEMRGVEHGDG